MEFVHCEECEFWGQSTTNSGYCMLLPPNPAGERPQTTARCQNLRDPQRGDYSTSIVGAVPTTGGCYSGSKKSATESAAGATEAA